MQNLGPNKLTRGSIQEALRMYLQPIKNDDPEVDFYTMYKRETMEYNTEYMQKYDEDLNTTLIFVRFCFPSCCYVTLTTSSGWSFLRRQLCLRHRRSVQASAGPRRTVGSLPPCNPPQSQPIHRSRRRPCRSPSVEWPAHRDYHNLEPPLRKFVDVSLGCVRRYAGQTMAEPVPPPYGWINDRTVW